MIFINFKTYKEGSGERALALAETISKVAKETNVEIIACPQEVDLRSVLAVTGQNTWVQHVDVGERGKTTGWFPAEIAKEVGVTGALLNHSEHKLTIGELGEAVKRCKQVGLKTLVFADGVKEAEIAAEFTPDFIGYEPPELVGSKETSVVMADPEIIKGVVAAVSPVKVLVGAGVHRKEDVVKSLEFGAVGVAVATDVVLADDPEVNLRKLAEGFSK